MRVKELSRTDLNRSPWRWTLLLVAALIVALLVPSGVWAQKIAPTAEGRQDEEIDSRWLPWLGCWQLVEEQPGLSTVTARHLGERVFVCLRLTDDGSGVTGTTVSDGQPILEKTILANGSQRSFEESNCRGWERYEWSRDGVRLFSRSEFTCDDEAERSVSGVSLLADSSTWLDIQLVAAEGDRELMVRRYRRASHLVAAEAGAVPLSPELEAMILPAARVASNSPMTISDVIEASEKIEPEAVEAALAETKASFDLDSDALIELGDAAVPESVINLMVALSYPDHFVVNRSASGSPQRGVLSGSSFGAFGPFDYPWYDTWYPYYATPFGYYYSYHRGYRPYYGRPYFGTVFLAPDDLFTVQPSDGTGRVVNGRGYTRLRSATGERRAKPRGSASEDYSISRRQSEGRWSGSSRSGGGSSAGRGGSRSGGSSGGRVSPGGYSRGGSSGSSGRSSGRTARPRTP